MKNPIQLSDHFTFGRLLRFTLPSIASMIFASIYGIVDGFFVSNYVGKIPFAGLNIIMPFIMMLGAVGNMVGLGGSALIGKTLGEGDREKANSLFSFFTYFMAAAGAVLGIVGNIFLPQAAQLLGAEGEVLENAVIYGRICLCGIMFVSLQYTMQGFLITAEKPHVGFLVTVGAGVTNMVLDWLFIAVFNWGIAGAAVATVMGQCVGASVPIIMFLNPKNNWNLKLGKAKFDGRSLLKACANGSSEFLSNISMSLVGMLYNAQLLKYAGNDGVVAYGVLMYVNMIFIAVFFGFTVGTSPVFSYNYGAGNAAELKSLFKKCAVIIASTAAVMFVSAELLAAPLAMIFTSYDAELLSITVHAFSIYSAAFLFCGVGIFGSALFTAMNNGLISALLSFFRTVVLQVTFVFVLPLLWQIDGIWWSAVIAEGIAAAVSIVFIIAYRKKYKYM